MPFTCAEVGEYYRLSAMRCEAELSLVVVGVVESAAVLARNYIGHPQNGWEPLSSATIEGFHLPSGRYIPGKDELGYGGPPDFDPLLREGDLRASIEVSVDGLRGIVGSAERTALWQELGTPGARYPIPPRPFLAKGLQESLPVLATLAGEMAIDLLTPKA